MSDTTHIQNLIIHHVPADVLEFMNDYDSGYSETYYFPPSWSFDNDCGWRIAVAQLIRAGLNDGRITNKQLRDLVSTVGGYSSESDTLILTALSILIEDLGIQLENTPDVFLLTQPNSKEESNYSKSARNDRINCITAEALVFLSDLLSNTSDPLAQYLKDIKPNQSREGLNSKSRKQHPQKYKGLKRELTGSQLKRKQGKSKRYQVARTRALPIAVRLRFDINDNCNISLIAKCSENLHRSIKVNTPIGEFELQALQNEWYLGVVPEELSNVLRNGTVWTQKSGADIKWSLGGRDLYVLGARNDISGYVSQPCLNIGLDHAVLFHESIKNLVNESIKATGAQPARVLSESNGLPRGWQLYCNVIPVSQVPHSDEADLFNALRPIPQIEISLKGGIRLENKEWLEGHPPQIFIKGELDHTVDVRIDGVKATRESNGEYRVAEWNKVGKHSIWCSGKTRTYSIIHMQENWKMWDAHKYQVAADSQICTCICGPLVQVLRDGIYEQRPSTSVPDTNPVLLGEGPGEIDLARKASDVRDAPLIATPNFRPIWALPSNPLICDKSSAKIIFIDRGGNQQVSSTEARLTKVISNREIRAWYRLILDANRRKLEIEPDTKYVKTIWQQFILEANQVRKRLR